MVAKCWQICKENARRGCQVRRILETLSACEGCLAPQARKLKYCPRGVENVPSAHLMHHPQPGINLPFCSCFPNQLFVCFPLLDFVALVEAGNCCEGGAGGKQLLWKVWQPAPLKGEPFACLCCQFHTSSAQSVQTGPQVMASQRLQRTFQVSERKLEVLGSLSRTSTSW